MACIYITLCAIFILHVNGEHEQDILNLYQRKFSGDVSSQELQRTLVITTVFVTKE